MKRSLLLLALLSVMVYPSIALSDSYSFNSNDGSGIRSDLNDLDHSYLYLWGINGDQLKGQNIVSATIQINNIRDWKVETDILKIYLLDNVKINSGTGVDILQIADSQQTNPANEIPYYGSGGGSMYPKFTSNTFIGSWSDPVGGTAVGYNLNFTFNAAQLAALNAYLLTDNPFGNNTTFGLGFDPDCHYYNDGITFNVETAPVPEPGTILLLGSGLIGMFSFGRRRMKG